MHEHEHEHHHHPRPIYPERILRTMITVLLCLTIGFGAGFLTCFIVKARQPEPEPVVVMTYPSFPEPEIIIQDTTPQEEPFVLTIATVEDIVRPASDLISMKYCYTDASTYENYKELFGQRIPFTTDKVVFTFDGVISVGIDLADVKYDIDNEARRIGIRVPELHVIANTIDKSSFDFPYQSDSVFNSSGMEDYMALVDTLEKEKEAEIMGNEDFIHSAEENTRTVLRAFLTASDATRDYQVTFR